MLLNTLFRHWSYRLFAPGTMLRERYEALKQLLNYDVLCHEQMAEFQDILHSGQPEDLVAVRRRFSEFSSNVREMVAALETIAPGSYASLKAYHKKFDFYTRFLLTPPKLTYASPFVYGLDDIVRENAEIGNKAKNLAILRRDLQLPVPEAFAVSSGGYHYLIEYNDLRPEIDRLLAKIRIYNPTELNAHAKALQQFILQSELPPLLFEEMLAGYDALPGVSDADCHVAVRSSAIIEDSGITFAGQYATVLHVDRSTLGYAYLQVLASKYSPEALFYRISHGLGDEETAMSVLVQKMVRPIAGGVLYTRDVAADNARMQLHAVPGFGEGLVGGHRNPDTYVFSREQPPVLFSCTGDCGELDRETAASIARHGLEIEQEFGCDQDIEWAVDQNGGLCFLQARPLHVSEPGVTSSLPEVSEAVILFDGCRSAAPGVACGPVYHLDADHDLDGIPEGAVLVTVDSPPEYVRVLNRLAAVIAEHGSRASHFATVAREFGVPLLVGKEQAFDSLPAGDQVTVDGDNGVVYRGKIELLLKKSER